MKIKTTFANIKNSNVFVLGVGYCELQKTLSVLGYDPIYYASTVYGWACDCHRITGSISIATGYDYDRACDITAYDLSPRLAEDLRTIEKKAYTVDFWNKEEVEELREEFITILENARKGEYEKKFCGYIDGKKWAEGSTKGEMRADFFTSREELREHYRLDHLPKYSDLLVVIE